MLDAPDFLNNNMLICQEIRACAARPVRARRRRLEPRWCLFRLTLPPPRARGACAVTYAATRGAGGGASGRQRRYQCSGIPWYVRRSRARARAVLDKGAPARLQWSRQLGRTCHLQTSGAGRWKIMMLWGLSGSSPHAPRCVQTNTRRGVFVPRSSTCTRRRHGTAGAPRFYHSFGSL